MDSRGVSHPRHVLAAKDFAYGQELVRNGLSDQAPHSLNHLPLGYIPSAVPAAEEVKASAAARSEQIPGKPILSARRVKANKERMIMDMGCAGGLGRSSQ